ncbi:hypothetical protein NQ318_008073 [Aromia moschata]|uniref:Uncharacterized protein n=1 Tax=Aromia moschata TaxID=1265417 RepID=A0AAV8YM44_9CUCU|nr:hypothetical protein NQ318_008073 [Aromia moschata]
MRCSFHNTQCGTLIQAKGHFNAVAERPGSSNEGLEILDVDYGHFNEFSLSMLSGCSIFGKRPCKACSIHCLWSCSSVASLKKVFLRGRVVTGTGNPVINRVKREVGRITETSTPTPTPTWRTVEQEANIRQQKILTGCRKPILSILKSYRLVGNDKK